MSAPKISVEEQEALRLSAKTELERLEAIYADKEVDQLLNEFRGKYNICEAVYKVFLLSIKELKEGKKQTILR